MNENWPECLFIYKFNINHDEPVLTQAVTLFSHKTGCISLIATVIYTHMHQPKLQILHLPCARLGGAVEDGV